MSDSLSVDLCIIGAGSAGLSVAAGAAQLGRKVVLIEKGRMGGDCLNYGCVPSKALLAAAKRAHLMRNADQFGITPVQPEIDFTAVQKHVHGVIETIAPVDSQERFEGLGCIVLRETARFTGKRTLVAGDTEVTAKHFVIATGSSPRIPPIKGIETVPYLTNETIFYTDEFPQHLLIVGGGPIGIEMAQAYRRLGADVTLIEGQSILPKDDPELIEIARNKLLKEGINLIENAEVFSVAGSAGAIELHYGKDGSANAAHGSHILIATGRAANVHGLDLEKAGVDYTEHGITVNRQLRTSNKRIFAAGDVAGGRQFTHVAGYHAGILVRNILFKTPSTNHEELAPWVTYMDPELAHVGLTEMAAKEAGHDVTVARWSYDENDRAHAEHTACGRIKVVIGKGGKILGASIIGAGAGDLIGQWALALANGIKIKAFTNMIAPYPTLGEISKRAAGAYYTPTLFSSKTRFLVRLLSIFD